MTQPPPDKKPASGMTGRNDERKPMKGKGLLLLMWSVLSRSLNAPGRVRCPMPDPLPR